MDKQVLSVAELWARLKQDGDRDARDRLILHYSPLVKYVVGRVSSGMPSHVDLADLLSYGVLGLIDAIEKFDPSRGIKFETYGVPRIRGAILDELRSIDWVPRSVRAKARAIDVAVETLEATLGRSPSDAELAEELEMSTDELSDVLGQTSRAGLIQLDEVLFASVGRRRTAVDDALRDGTAVPGADMEIQETRRQLAGAIRHLGDRERHVLTLYYYEGLNLAEIGEILGVSESRTCQIHSKAVVELRRRLKAEMA